MKTAIELNCCLGRKEEDQVELETRASLEMGSCLYQLESANKNAPKYQ